MLIEAIGWYLDWVDDNSVDKHMEHGDVVIGSFDAEVVEFTEDSCATCDGFQPDNRDDDQD